MISTVIEMLVHPTVLLVDRPSRQRAEKDRNAFWKYDTESR